jgi:branched-subunit amino acid transport protein
MTLWFAIVAVAVISFTIKAAGPAILTGRDLPAWTGGVIALLAPSLLAALVVVHLIEDFSLAVLAGLAAVVVAHLLRAPMLVSVLAGVVATASLRAFVTG